jgi:AraC family transcriptional regulator
MTVRNICDGGVRVIDYKCEAGPGDEPFDEVHDRFSLSYVRRGSFGCVTGGRRHDLVAGSFLLGFPGDEFKCTHEHHDCGDECLSIQISPEIAEPLSSRADLWRVGMIPPLASLGAMAEVAQAAADEGIDISPEEAGLMVVARFVDVIAPGRERDVEAQPMLRRRMARVADWMHSRLESPVSLDEAAREAGLSSYHFLRGFRQVTGVTPHQYLVRLRLGRAARLLVRTDLPVTQVALDAGFEDLSNFIRTFRRATGKSPGRFRALRQVGLRAGSDLALAG